MAWCPKCRNEYVEGITFCSDCNCDLVDELEEIKEIKYINIKGYPNPDEIVDYLHQANVSSAEYCEIEQDGTITGAIGVSPKDYFDATINLSVFFENISEEDLYHDQAEYTEETDYLKEDGDNTDATVEETNTSEAASQISHENNTSNTAITDESTSSTDDTTKVEASDEDRIPTYGNAVYVTYADRYEDVKSSAYTLLFVGTLGGLALILEIAKVFQFPIAQETKWLFYLVFGGMMLGFIVYGFISYQKANSLREKAIEENKTIDEINEWSKESLVASDIDSNIETDIQEELLYFNRIEYIKDKIMHQFEEADEPLVDSLLENIYSSLFESEE